MAKMGEFFKSNYFNADSLLEGDMTLTISHCQAEVFESRDKSKADDQKMVVYFHEDERGLALNVTNWQTIIDITGQDDTDNWPNCQITLTRKKDKGIGGQQVWCVRVKAPAPDQNRQQRQQQQPPAQAQRPLNPRAAAAQQNIRGGQPQIDEGDVPF